MNKKVTTNKKVAAKKKAITKKAQSAIDQLFKKAEPPKKPKKLKKRPSSKERTVVPMGKNFDVYCALAILDKVVEAQKKVFSKEFKDASFHIFYDMLKEGDHPESFIGQYQNKQHAEARALFSLKRGHELSDDLAAVLLKHGISFSRIVTEADASYMLNPNLFGADQEVLAKLAEAIKGVEGLDPADVFLPCEPVSQNFITDETIASVMEKVTNDKERAKIIKQITSLQIASTTLGDEEWNSQTAKDAAIKILKDFGLLT
jgi:hypothetical protein